jgi:hypothetical protein
LKFKNEENSEKSLALELANYTFNENGMIVESYAKSFVLRFDEARYRQALAEGLTYLNDFPVKKPGAYQFRSALRDANSGQMGSSNQFIQVPDLKKDRLLLSGITLNNEIEYLASIYTPRLDKQTGKPNLKLQFEIYRDGKRIFQSPGRPVRTDRQTDPKWLDCGERFQLKNFSAGDYLLRVLVKDELRQGKNAVTEQWIDFTVR